MQNLNDLFLKETETFEVELQNLTSEANANNLDMKKLLRPLNDYSENSLSEVGQIVNHEFVKGEFQHYKLIDNNGLKVSLSNLLGRAVKSQPFKFKANRNGLAMLDETESINKDLVEFSKGKTTLEMVAFLKGKYFKATPVKQFSYFAPTDKDSKNTLQFFNSLNEVDVLGYIPLKQFFKIELITKDEYEKLTQTVETQTVDKGAKSAKPKK